MGLILITHDLGVVADVADRIVVMYAGRVVEQAPVTDLYATPAHPYTEGLLASIPTNRHQSDRGQLTPIKGAPPNLAAIPPGCPFHPRCSTSTGPLQRKRYRTLRTSATDHQSACHYAEDR